MSTISVPDYDFSGFYYPEIYQAQLQYLRVNAPELTSEEDEEPHIQLARAYSLVGHTVNTYVDVVANEQLNDSLTLRESMKRLYKLINVKLASATPAICNSMLIRLSSIPTSNIGTYIPQYTQFGTTPDDDGEQVLYETTTDWPLDRCEQVSYVFSQTTEHTDVNGSVDSAVSTEFTDAGGYFVAGDVGKKLQIANSQNGNEGIYEITEYVSANTVKIASAAFNTETDLHWWLYDYSSDYATEANASATPFTPWSAHADRNMLYIGHKHVQWDQLDVTSTTQSNGLTGVWEYYDPTYSNSNPNSVIEVGGTIRFKVNSLVPQYDWGEGQIVKVTYNPTGVSETLVSTWSGTDSEILTKSLLGQSSPIDTTITNYTISSDWVPLIDDSTQDFASADETFEWTNPMDDQRKWTSVEINEETAYWVRYRVTSDISPSVLPILDEADIENNNVYFPFEVTQGVTIETEDLGSSNGQTSQEFTTLTGPVFDDSQTVEVDETDSGVWITWTPQDNLLSSGVSDRHYSVELDDEERQVYTFGNGTFGRIPPIDAGIRSTYRVGGEESGNVGIGEIQENISGLSFVGAMGNTMAATGWTIKEAGDETDLERMKIAGPASLRDNTKAANASDIERIVVNEYTYNDAKIVARAVAIEEAYGPKTFKLLVVGTGGEFLTTEQLADLEEYFNGNKYVSPQVEKKLISNHELTALNYSPYEVDVTVNVIGTGLTVGEIRTALNSYLDPLSVDSDGNYVHDFGGQIAEVLIDCAIKEVSNNISNIIKTVPSSDITIGENQLPIPGDYTITITEG